MKVGSCFEAVAQARLSDDVLGGATDPPRACAGPVQCTRAGNWSPTCTPGPTPRGAATTPNQSALRADRDLEQSRLGGRQPNIDACALRLLASKVDRELPGLTTASSSAWATRRIAARSLASSSSMPNGLVT